jgi:hypothetical protein
LRTELHPLGVEVVTVSLELSGPEASRPFIEAAAPEHPSLLDPMHRLDSLFGVVNIPNVTWIDEDGMIVRPPEPGWPGDAAVLRPATSPPSATVARAETPVAEDPEAVRRRRLGELLSSGQERSSYPRAIRDWAVKGAESEYRLTPDEVIARSQPRPMAVSEAAAQFELANHFWRQGNREAAFRHFRSAHALQPENWTYKRQAWSLLGHERVGGDRGRFAQGPLPGEEAAWPFETDFMKDVMALGPGEYYPRTMPANPAGS